MATCRDIVTRALRMTGVLQGDESPDADELRDGLTVLQSLYDSWLVGGMFGRLTDVYEAGDYEALEGQRIYIDSGEVTLPTEIDDARKPRDLVAIEAFDDNGRRVWLWDRTAWVQINALTENSDAPLADRGANGLAACLALAYAEEFGAEIKSSAVIQARNFKTALSFKFGSEREPSVGSFY
jgi:hypothetical protein